MGGGGGTEVLVVKEGIGVPRKGVRVFISRYSLIIESLFINKNNKIITTTKFINHTLT